MYDLHNHLLPGIDDGSQDIETSIKLAQIAVEDGITHMVCTPHIHPGHFDNTEETIQQALEVFIHALKEKNINLTVSAAAEVHIGPEILQKTLENKLPFIGKWLNKNVVLLEFPTNQIPIGTEKLVKWLLNHDIVPMIAHPERNTVFREQPQKLEAFINQGCLIQVTASAILGRFGSRAQESAETLLLNNQITIMASDAHNIEYRPPKLADAYAKVAELTSLENAKKLFIDTPKKISSSKFKPETD